MSDLEDRDSKTVSLAARSPHFRVNTRFEAEEDEYLGTEKKRATIVTKPNNTDRFSFLIYFTFPALFVTTDSTKE